MSYAIYRDGVYLAGTATTSYADTGASDNLYFCYTVRAVDFSGNRSDPSGQQCVIMHGLILGGERNDFAYDLIGTIDGGVLIAGSTYSYGAGRADAYLIELDTSGNIAWEKTFGSSGNDDAQDVKQTADGGFILVGSNDQYSNNTQGVYLVKTDADGLLQWENIFNIAPQNKGTSVTQTSDGGYIIISRGLSYNISVVPDDSIHLIKTGSDGTLLWQQTFFDKGAWENPEEVFQTADGGYALVIKSIESNAPDETYLIKTDNTGNTLWGKTFDIACGSAIQTSDDGFALTHFKDGASTLTKLDANGSIQWESSYDNISVLSIQQTSDGGFVVAGNTIGTVDVYVAKLDFNGAIQWSRTYGGIFNENADKVTQVSDGGYVLLVDSAFFHETYEPKTIPDTAPAVIYVLRLDASGAIID